jgi:hypothetical protein
LGVGRAQAFAPDDVVGGVDRTVVVKVAGMQRRERKAREPGFRVAVGVRFAAGTIVFDDIPAFTVTEQPYRS